MDDDFWSEQAWDDRYRQRPRVWTGEPNAAVVTEVADLEPGAAFDVGCGEGGDAIWLARRGWQVTGSDLSQVALARAADAAAGAGVAVEFVHQDLLAGAIPSGYDLVTAAFVHLPGDRRQLLFTRLAAAVAPGGTLLVLGHDLTDLETSMPRAHLAEAGWTAEQVAACLDDGWTVDTCEARPRTATHEGREVTVHDAVLRAHRPA